MRKAVVAVLLFLVLAVWAAAEDVPLKAGLARVEITPSSLMPMYGYAKRKCGPANGTHDPLFAKALVLRTGDSAAAIVTLDIGSFVSDRLRQEVAAKLGIPILLLAASHTHSGPDFLSRSESGPTPEGAEYLSELERKVFGVVRDASASMFPARLSAGRGSLQLGYNRLLMRDDGRARALFENPERIPYGPVDPEFMLLRVEDTAGAVRALVVHYACHAVVLGPTNCKYSADYPGVLQARIESEMKGTQCMFVQGAAGDVNPLFLARTGKEEEDFATVRKMGELLAAQVLRSAREMKPGSPNGFPIQYTSEVLKFSDRWEKEKQLEVGITTLLINREIAIAAVPGEPLHKLQRLWKGEADVPYPLFYGYTYSSGGSWPGYIPDVRSAAYGGYGADVTTRIEVGAGETIIQRHLIALQGLLGRWHDKPGRP